jgi:PTH1 family peptidyl-tRNA hydrolase
VAEKPSAGRWVVAGLGNPGPSYASTRHNVGARAVEVLAARWGLSFRSQDGLLWCAAENEMGATAYLVLPQTYMNCSGEVLVPFSKYRNVPPERVLVVVDDMDLPPGRLRVRLSGSSGGHHGLDSIIAHLGTADFPRFRIGIGKPPVSGLGRDWVLSGFLPEEREAVEESVQKAADGIVAFIEKGPAAAMQAYNGGLANGPRNDERK